LAEKKKELQFTVGTVELSYISGINEKIHNGV
jgi:hypothetical protein